MDQLVQRGTLPADFVSGAIALARYFEVVAQFASTAQSAAHPTEERFVAAMRLAQLLVEQLPRHPDLARYPRWQTRLQEQAADAVRLAESLKLDLRAQLLGLTRPPPPVVVVAVEEKEEKKETKAEKKDSIAAVPGRGRKRRMRVAAGLFEAFGRVAQSNTGRNVETCGLLCGREEGEGLAVDTVLVPEQKGTSDTCGATDEEGLLEAQLRLGLSCLGWIHTHPRHSCFLSSVDLHTSVSYQVRASRVTFSFSFLLYRRCCQRRLRWCWLRRIPSFRLGCFSCPSRACASSSPVLCAASTRIPKATDCDVVLFCIFF
jgi:proteasome lid subunit RPN8/RPN11